MNDPLTTDELLREEADLTGIPLDQLKIIVAKSGLVRHLASDPETQDRFIVKGGTLLYHCYRGPRASFRDVDFAYPSGERLEAAASIELIAQMQQDVERSMNIATETFTVRAEDGRWSFDHAEIATIEQVPFTVAGLTCVEDDGHMKLSVSIRASERMHDPDTLIDYEDRMLADGPTFPVQGLCIEELAAEKFLGWGLKGLRKHFIDLAVIGHRYPGLDQQLVVDLVRRKVARERTQDATRGLYHDRGVRRSADLVVLLRSPARTGLMSQRGYEEALGTEVVLTDEKDRTVPVLSDARKVKLAFGFWDPVLGDLERG